MAQQVKDPVLSLQQLRLLPRHSFHPWTGNFHMPQVQPKKKKEKKRVEVKKQTGRGEWTEEYSRKREQHLPSQKPWLTQETQSDWSTSGEEGERRTERY